MSRHPRDREYRVADRYEERESDFYRRPRHEREYEDLEVDMTRSSYPEPQRESRRAETVVKERDTVVSDRRTERGPRVPDFLREDYGKQSNAGQLVVRQDDSSEDDYVSRAPSRRSRAPTERPVEKEETIFKESERSAPLPYPRSQKSEVTYRDDEDRSIVYRERARSRPPRREERDEIDIKINREESRAPPPPRSEAPVEEIRFRRGGGDRPAPPKSTVEKTEIDITERERGAAPPPSRARTVIDREEIDIRESRRSPAPPPPRKVEREEFEFREREVRSPPGRGRDFSREEIDINIREQSRGPPPRHRSQSRGVLVGRKEEEWIVRRPRTPPPREYEKEEIIIRRKERSPSPEPPPPPANYEKEEIIIRRKARTPSPEPPPREPTPEPEPEPSPPPPPALEPIYRPPIIQEVITHHRHIDHGVERARSPSPPPAPPSPPPAPAPPKEETKEDDLEISISRKGVRNGKAYDEEITFERERKETETPSRELERYSDRKRSVSVVDRRRSPSPRRRHYDDEMAAEAEYYNRKISSRAYPGEAYNGATKDWGLVDIPPGTERVRMDGVGGGAQEVYWDRYAGQRKGRFISGDRIYEDEYGSPINGHRSPPPLPPPPPASAPPRESRETKEEIKITHTHTNEERPRDRKRDKMWTEVTKDLVIKEAIEEMGYDYEETDEHFYVIEYLKYEDVLRLVEISEEIKKERRDRILEIQWEREERERRPKMLPAPPPIPAPPRPRYDERIYEREIIYDRDGRRWRR
ncbi:hypothetical protein DOTSEDRAFT_70857 [Dothistroma septosporum NZE10]|uniref:DUF8035 domain-containing protein n=1 Tax=Dothistroma septosporum (strain NZE10 / CBS 128990) TaxID=675120 RepID=N1PNH0_DOTSN|nr:hypothetical protein DOTSEDRAFT_70857 [Dothistroma septosporum NZE10]